MIIQLTTSDYSQLRERLVKIATRTYKFSPKEPKFFDKLHGFVRKVPAQEESTCSTATGRSSFGPRNGMESGENATSVIIVLDEEKERHWMKQWLLYWSEKEPEWIQLHLSEGHPSFLEHDWTHIEDEKESSADVAVARKGDSCSQEESPPRTRKRKKSPLQHWNQKSASHKKTHSSTPDKIQAGNVIHQKHSPKEDASSHKSKFTRMSSQTHTPKTAPQENSILTKSPASPIAKSISLKEFLDLSDDDDAKQIPENTPLPPISRRFEPLPPFDSTTLLENFSKQLSIMNHSETHGEPKRSNCSYTANFLLTPQHILQNATTANQVKQQEMISNMFGKMSKLYQDHLDRLTEENQRLRDDLRIARKERDEAHRERREVLDQHFSYLLGREQNTKNIVT